MSVPALQRVATALVVVLVVSNASSAQAAEGSPAVSGVPPYLQPPPAFDESEQQSGGSSALAYSGYALWITAFVALAAGAYSGYKVSTLRDSVESGRLDQLKASSRLSSSDTWALRANALFGVGGLLGVSGTGLLGFDLVQRLTEHNDHYLAIAAPPASPPLAQPVSQPVPQAEPLADPQLELQLVALPGAPIAASVAPTTEVPKANEDLAKQTLTSFCIEGTVLDSASGAPVSGAMIVVAGVDEPLRLLPPSWLFRTELLKAPSGSVRVEARAQGYATTQLDLNVSGGGERLLTIEIDRLKRGARLRGSINDARTGRPLRAVLFFPASNRLVNTSDDGTFSIDIRDGVSEVLISSKGYVTQHRWARAARQADVIFNIDLVPQAGRKRSGASRE